MSIIFEIKTCFKHAMAVKTCTEKIIMNEKVFYLSFLQLSDLNSREYNHIKMLLKKYLTFKQLLFWKRRVN